MRTKGSVRVAIIITASILAACGGDPKANTGYNRPAKPRYTERQVAVTLGVTMHPGGQYTDGIPTDPATGCTVDVFLLSTDQVRQYADAGDPVATNPAGTVGVKVGSYQGVDERMCLDKFQAELKTLP